MRCPEAELPHRVERLFQEISDVPAPLPYQRGNWHLQPAEGWKTAEDIGAMAPGYKNPWKERGLAFSPSVLKRFLACPMRFWIREALHMNEEEFLPDKEDMAVNELGTMLHDVLECFCREHAVLKDGMNAASFQDAITEILEQTFRKQYGPSPLMPLLLQKRSMEQRLSVYAAQHLQALQEGWSCIAFERQVENWILGGFPMKFRIDRIDRHADGRIRVIDYKTGAASSCEKSIWNRSDGRTPCPCFPQPCIPTPNSGKTESWRTRAGKTCSYPFMCCGPRKPTGVIPLRLITPSPPIPWTSESPPGTPSTTPCPGMRNARWTAPVPGRWS